MAQIGGGGYAGSRPLETSDATKMLVDGPCICSRQGSRLLKAASVGPMSRETPSAPNRFQPSGADPTKNAAAGGSALGNCFADGGHDFVCPEVQCRVADGVARREQVDESGGGAFKHGESQFLYPLRHSAPGPAALIVARSEER